MSAAPLFRYVIVSPDSENLKKEVANVAAHVDVFEISESLCQSLMKETKDKDVVRKMFNGKSLLVKLSETSITKELLDGYVHLAGALSLPVDLIFDNTDDTVDFKTYNIEADLTECDVDKVEDKVGKAIELGVKGIRVNQDMLDKCSGCGVNVSVQLDTFDAATIKKCVTAGANVLIFKYTYVLSDAAASAVTQLKDVIATYNAPLVNIDGIVAGLYKIQSKYNETDATDIKTCVELITGRPNITKYLSTNLEYINKFIAHTKDASDYERTYVNHEIAIMSKANTVANYRQLIEHAGEARKKTLQAERDEAESQSDITIADLQSTLDASTEQEDVLIPIRLGCDTLLDLYKSMTVLYYSHYKEYIALKAEVGGQTDMIQSNLNYISKEHIRRVTRDDYGQIIQAHKKNTVIDATQVTPNSCVIS